MALAPETPRHLARAERNRALARALTDPEQCPSVRPPPLEWASVAAFYAAVHYASAHLWERLGVGIDRTDHASRRRYIARLAELRPGLGAYDLLYDLGWQARYIASFQPPPAVIQQAVHDQLDAFRAVVYTALGTSSPP